MGQADRAADVREPRSREASKGEDAKEIGATQTPSAAQDNQVLPQLPQQQNARGQSAKPKEKGSV